MRKCVHVLPCCERDLDFAKPLDKVPSFGYPYYLTSTDNAFLDRRQPSFSTRIDELNSFCCLQVVCGLSAAFSAADNLQTTSSLPVTSCKGLSAVKKSENELTESCQLDCIFVVCGGKMLSAVDCG